MLNRQNSQLEIASLPVVSESQAEHLLQQLANAVISEPRLELPFELWGALVARDEWRKRLYQQRQEKTLGEDITSQVVVNLSQWLENIFENTWQSIEGLFGSEANFAYSFRQTNALSEASIKRVKVVDVPTQIGNQALVLMVSLAAEANGRVGILVQLSPMESDRYLPARVRLILMSASGEVVQSIEARDEDNSMQLKRFKCPVNTQFKLQVALDGFSFTEEFVS